MNKLEISDKKITNAALKKQDKRQEESFNNEISFQRKQSYNFKREYEDVREECRKISTFYSDKGAKGYKMDRLYPLICNKGLLWASLQSVKNWWGLLSPGMTCKEDANLKYFGTIEALSKSLQSEEYEPTPIKKVFIPVQSVNDGESKVSTFALLDKKSTRSLGIPSLEDKIVQEALTVVLTAVFEPEFTQIDKNYGLRPNKSAHDAVECLKKKGRGMTYAVQGDFTNMCDNLKHDLFIKVVKSKTNDKKIVRLIKKLLKAGYLYSKELAKKEIDLPQKGIIEPFFFNMCANEFDKYTFTLEELLNDRNRAEMRKDRAKSQRYESLRTQIKYRRDWITKLLRGRSFQLLERDEQVLVKEKHEQIKMRQKQLMKTKSIAQHLNRLRMCYVRYGDSWILLTNWNKGGAFEIKNLIRAWLQRNLELELNAEKIVITEITNTPAKFAGFTFKNSQRYVPAGVIEMGGQNRKRRTARGLLVGVDKERVLSRMQTKGFITQDNPLKSKRNGVIQVLKPPEIVEKYQQILSKVFDYYYSGITYKSTLLRLYYYLFYSCLHTIAARQKCSIATLFGKHTKKMVWVTKEVTIEGGREIVKNKTVKLLPYKEMIRLHEVKRRADNLKRIGKKVRLVEPRIHRTYESQSLFQVESLFDYSVNLRSRKAALRYCVVCRKNSSQAILQTHHLKPLSKGKSKAGERTDTFKNAMRHGASLRLAPNLNARQVTVCQECHRKIHGGALNGLTSEEKANLSAARKQPFF